MEPETTSVLEIEACEDISDIFVRLEDRDLINKLEKLAKFFMVSEDVIVNSRKQHVLEIMKALREKDTESRSNFSVEKFIASLGTWGLDNSRQFISRYFPSSCWVQPSLRKEINDFMKSRKLHMIIYTGCAIATSGKLSQQLSTFKGYLHHPATSDNECAEFLNKFRKERKLVVSVMCESVMLLQLLEIMNHSCKLILITKELNDKDKTPEEKAKQIPIPKSVVVTRDDLMWSHITKVLQEKLLGQHITVVGEENTDTLKNVISKKKIIAPLDCVLKGEFLQELLNNAVLPTWPKSDPPSVIDSFKTFLAERAAFAQSQYSIDKSTFFNNFTYLSFKAELTEWAEAFKGRLWDGRIGYKALASVGVVSEWGNENVPKFLEQNVPKFLEQNVPYYFLAKYICQCLKGRRELEHEEENHVVRFLLNEVLECSTCANDIDHEVGIDCIFTREVLSKLVSDILGLRTDYRSFPNERRFLSMAITSGENGLQKLTALGLEIRDEYIPELFSVSLRRGNFSAFKYINNHLVEACENASLLKAKDWDDMEKYNFKPVWNLLNSQNISMPIHVDSNLDKATLAKIVKFLDNNEVHFQKGLNSALRKLVDPQPAINMESETNFTRGDDVVFPSCSSYQSSSCRQIADVHDNTNSDVSRDEANNLIEVYSGNAGGLVFSPDETESESISPGTGSRNATLCEYVENLSTTGGNENLSSIKKELFLTSVPSARVLLPNLTNFEVQLKTREIIQDGRAYKDYVKRSCKDLHNLIFFDKKIVSDEDYALGALINGSVNISLKIQNCLVFYINHDEGKLVLNMLNDAQRIISACGDFKLKALFLQECSLSSLNPLRVEALEVIVFRRVEGLKNHSKFLDGCSKLKEITWFDFGNENLILDTGLIHRNPDLRKIVLTDCNLQTPTNLEACQIEYLYLQNCIYDVDFFQNFSSAFSFLEEIVLLQDPMDSHHFLDILKAESLKSVWVWRLELRKEDNSDALTKEPKEIGKIFKNNFVEGHQDRMSFNLKRESRKPKHTARPRVSTSTYVTGKPSNNLNTWTVKQHSVQEMRSITGPLCYEDHGNNVFYSNLKTFKLSESEAKNGKEDGNVVAEEDEEEVVVGEEDRNIE